MLVYVLNKDGKPLMPCKPAKARHLLQEGKAKVKRTEPFTIQLLYGSSGYKQDVTLGVDAGSKHIGLSATTEKKELYASETELRSDIVASLSSRRQYRRSRRNRKTRYRQPRFQNRVHSKNKGWLAPSIENKINTHLKVIRDAHKILPISKIIVEVASFDIQKIKNPDISGIEYQQGNQLGFWNVRAYVLWRDGYTCQCCHGKSKDKRLNVHHIKSRKTGGNSPDNLATVCKTCHGRYHAGEITFNFKMGKSFRDAAFMGIMRWSFYNRLKEMYPDVHMTYGYITKNTRISNNLPKMHSIDAYCITGNVNAKLLDYYFYQKQTRTVNRQIHKVNILKGGVRKLNQAPKYVFGFQLFDKVKYDKKQYYVFGRRASGGFDIRTLDGTKVNSGSVSHKKLIKLESRKSILIERRNRAPLMTEVTSLRAEVQ